jgi:hypothetical protein
VQHNEGSVKKQQVPCDSRYGFQPTLGAALVPPLRRTRCVTIAIAAIIKQTEKGKDDSGQNR